MSARLLALLCLGLGACEAGLEEPVDRTTSPPGETRPEPAEARYVEMPDGVHLAADVWLPPGSQDAGEVPALLSVTRYWRSKAFDPPAPDRPPIAALANAAGYAAIIVDARGSGASFGSRAAEFSTCETRDFRFILEWIAGEPWSNGKVATIGISYSGNTAEHATFDPTDILAAAVPRFTDFDAYTGILMPGGLRNAFISATWADGVTTLDENRVPGGAWRSSSSGRRLLGVAPVDGDTDGRLLAEAVAEHEENQDLDAWFSSLEFREDLRLATDLADDCRFMVSPYRFLDPSLRRATPAYHWGSWMDAGTAAGVLARFASDPDHGAYIIGAWSHGAEHDANVFKPDDAPVVPSVADQHRRILAFLAPYLESGEAETTVPDGLTYFTMGEDRWKQTDRWPPAGSERQTWHLAANQRLQREPPGADIEYDRYPVDFSAGSGQSSRWSTQLGGGDVFYGDRRDADERLLTYTSLPIGQALEITGSPTVELYVASTHEDGAVIAYLEAVAPDGSVTMITEGQLRLIHRATSSEPPEYPQAGPHHSFKRADATPMIPGEVAQVAFAMLPTSVRIPAGYALRLAIAGHDKDAFERYPAVGDPVLDVYFTPVYPSSLSLPVIAAGH